MVEVIEALEGLETGVAAATIERGRGHAAAAAAAAVPASTTAAASLLFDDRGNPVALPTPEERARDLFKVRSN